MSWFSENKGGPDKHGENPQGRALDVADLKLEPELEQALKDFKSSLHVWSDAAYHRPRAISVRRRSWRLAAGWALGCALVAGSVSGAVLERNRREAARAVEAQRTAEQARELAERQARANVSDEVLLAEVDTAVSRQVPSAMEPLAQLMDETGK